MLNPKERLVLSKPISHFLQAPPSTWWYARLLERKFWLDVGVDVQLSQYWRLASSGLLSPSFRFRKVTVSLHSWGNGCMPRRQRISRGCLSEVSQVCQHRSANLPKSTKRTNIGGRVSTELGLFNHSLSSFSGGSYNEIESTLQRDETRSSSTLLFASRYAHSYWLRLIRPSKSVILWDNSTI